MLGKQVAEEEEATATAWAQQRPTRAATATAASTPTESPESSFDEPLSETPAVNPPPNPPNVPAAWTTLIADTFDNNASGWEEGTEDDEWANGDLYIEDGNYQWDLFGYKDFTWRVTPAMQPLADFSLSVDAQQFGGSSETIYFGMFFRYSYQDEENNYYSFTIANDQTFQVGMIYQDNWEELVEWQEALAIKPEGVNNLAVIGKGSSFSFIINGEEVATMEDDTLPEGKTGIIIGMDAGDETQFSFDNFTLSAPPESVNFAPVQSIAPHIPSAWSLKLSDTFDTQSLDWDLGEFEDEWSIGTQSLSDGKYIWEALGVQDYIWWTYPSGESLTDFAATVEARRMEGPHTSSEYGLVFRYQKEAESFYVFRVTDNQNFKVSISSGEEWENLIDWTTSPAIRPRETNQLSVVAEGSLFRFFINGQPVGEISDTRLQEGIVGIFVSGGEGEEAVFEFDNYEVHTP